MKRSPVNRSACVPMLAIACLVAVAIGSNQSLAQSLTSAFEAADVHASPRRPLTERPAFRLVNGRYQVRNATLLDLVATAYGVSAEKVVGGPSWLELDRFDILAKVRAGGPAADVKPMLKALLAERFGLVVREAESDVPSMALVVNGVARLQPARRGQEPGCAVTLGRRLEMMATCRSASMAAFVAELTRMNGGYFSTPLVDMTGLMDKWDFDLTWAQRGMLEQSPQAADKSLFEALAALGLELEPRTTRAPAVVVEHANRTPTPNAPDLATKLAAGPTRFEVASIKLTAPDSNWASFTLPGRVNFTGSTLRGLIMNAWNLPSQEHLAAPSRIEATRFDLVAQYDASEGALDQDGVRPLLRTLLEERFRVRTHTENRPLPVTILTASQPKLTPADQTRRTKCTAAISDDDLRRRVTGVRRLTCQNMTMAQFADRLPSFGAWTVLAIDETGLEGAWDFSVTYSPAASSQAAQAWRGVSAEGIERRTGDPTAAAEPAVGLTFAEALERQLGLTLKIEKRPGPVLVVDSADERPTDN